MRHRYEIDGLRAIAVIPVVLFHAGFSGFSGGYIGVDVFFVISGYLITGIIINELNSNTFSIRDFYERRARRILPALFFVTLCCIPFGWLWMLPAQFKDFSQTIFAVSVFSSNILFAFKHRYFSETAVDEKPLLHTWSLGVEEQFYVLFPILLMLLWRFARNRTLLVIAVIAVISLLASEWGWRHAPYANFYLLTSRAWELLAGSICAFVLFGQPQKRNNLLSALGLALIAASIFVFDRETPFPSVFTLVPVVGTCLIILYGSEGTYVSRLLSMRAFVGIGLISYSAYLWHQPLFAFARIKSLFPPEQWLMALLSGVTFILAYGSWRFVETPFRRKGYVFFGTTKQVFAGAVVVTSGLMVFGLYGQLTNGKEKLWEASVSPAVSKMYRLISDAKGANLHTPQDDGGCKFNVENLNDAIEKRILDCREKHGRGIAVVGDSHAIDLFGAIGSVMNGSFLVGVTQGYCRPHSPAPYCQYDRFREFISNNDGVFRKVIFEQTARTLLLDEDGKGVTSATFLARPKSESFPALTVNHDNIVKVRDYLLGLAEYTDVTWLGPRIEPHISQALMLKTGCGYRYTLDQARKAPFSIVDEAIRARGRSSRQRESFQYISQIDLIDLDMRKDFTSCEELYWSDGNHWSAHGEKLFGQRLRALVTF